MKKLMTLFAIILFAGAIFACDAPDGYAERQKVQVYYSNGNSVGAGGIAQVYHATNMCDAYCICYKDEIFYVSKSDKSGYGYMFWRSGSAYYFNM